MDREAHITASTTAPAERVMGISELARVSADLGTSAEELVTVLHFLQGLARELPDSEEATTLRIAMRAVVQDQVVPLSANLDRLTEGLERLR